MVVVTGTGQQENRNCTCVATGPLKGRVYSRQVWTQTEVIKPRENPSDRG